MSFFKRYFLLLLSFCSSSIIAADSPKEPIESFYRNYFAHLKRHSSSKDHPPFSNSFAALVIKNQNLCKRHHTGDICGWGADGDPYLDAQDYDDKLNLKNSEFSTWVMGAGEVHVRFTLFPNGEAGKKGEREIVYKMQKQNEKWVVDDIIYMRSAESARKALEQENKSLLKP